MQYKERTVKLEEEVKKQEKYKNYFMEMELKLNELSKENDRLNKLIISRCKNMINYDY